MVLNIQCVLDVVVVGLLREIDLFYGGVMAKYRVIRDDYYSMGSISTRFVVQKAYNFLFMTFWVDVENASFWNKEDAIRLVDELVELCDKPVNTIYTK